jgi:uracil-DNA glycosylase family 4
VRPDAFVERLAAADFGAAFNFYRDGDGAGIRRARLRRYLAGRRAAPVLLVGEAPGYRGARVSGVPFTSERQLTGSGPAEATATIVHRVLAELGLEHDVLLWNALPAHPHLPDRPRSNRRPTRTEIDAGRPFLDELARGRRVIAVGRVAGDALGLTPIRHPSRGGAVAFRDGLAGALSRSLERPRAQLLRATIEPRRTGLSASFLCRDEDLERETG